MFSVAVDNNLCHCYMNTMCKSSLFVHMIPKGWGLVFLPGLELWHCPLVGQGRGHVWMMVTLDYPCVCSWWVSAYVQ